MMRTFGLSAYLATCLILLGTVPVQAVNVTDCVGKPLNLSCPDGYKVTFIELRLGGPGQSNGSQCLPLATDCSYSASVIADPMLTMSKMECLWQKSSCSLLLASWSLRSWNGCSFKYMKAVDVKCIKDHIQVTTDTKVLTIPRNKTTYLTNEGHPKVKPKSYYNTRLELAGGISLKTMYALGFPKHAENTGSCDSGSLVIKTNGEVYGEFCGSDTIQTKCLANVSLEATLGGSEFYKGFALTIEPCELPCEDSNWKKVCNPDHVVAARVYSGGPGSRDDSRCQAAPGDCRRTIPNASQCLWSQSECTFDVATVDGDECNVTYIRAVGAACVPKSSIYTLKDAEAAETVQLPVNSSINYVISPGHPAPVPENMNFSLGLKAPPGYGISLGTHLPMSLPPRDKSQCPQLNSLRVKAGWANTNPVMTEYVSCGTDEFQYIAVGDEAWLQFRTGSNAEGHDGFVLRIEIFRLSTSADVSTTPASVPSSGTEGASTEDPKQKKWKLTYTILAVFVPLMVICLAFICACVVRRRNNRRSFGIRQTRNGGPAMSPLEFRNGNAGNVRSGNGHVAPFVDPGSICSVRSQRA